MIWIARAAVLLAAVTTLYFNGSYAWLTADAAHGKIGFVAMALAIDLAKITFLGAVAWCWDQGYRVRAVCLLVLWPFAFSASTFMAYASITTQRQTATAITTGKADDRLRFQDRYDRTREALTAARRSPAWSSTAGCTTPTTSNQRQACGRITDLQKTLDTLADQLGPAPILTAQQDLAQLAAETQIPVARLAFLAAFLPAVLLELLASLGSYAVGAKPSFKSSPKPSGSFWKRKAGQPGHGSQKPPETLPEALAAPPIPAPATPRLPKFPRAQPAP